MPRHDQLDIGNLASLELVARHLQLREGRHRDLVLGAKSGDSSQHDECYYFAGMASTRGPMTAPALSAWISEQVARENATARGRRKAREGRALARPQKEAKGGHDE